MSPLLADFIHARGCKPICAKLLTLPGSFLGSLGSPILHGQMKAAALSTQSRRRSYGRVKGLLDDGFFLFAVVRQTHTLLQCKV